MTSREQLEQKGREAEAAEMIGRSEDEKLWAWSLEEFQGAAKGFRYPRPKS
jgi:hypothetical protein